MKKIFTLLLLTSLASCNKNNDKADGYGNFEATEVTISAEANGKINYLKLEEGDILEPNTVVGLVDTTQLYLNKQQLIASKASINSKSKNVLSQINVLKEQLKTTLIEQKRIQEQEVLLKQGLIIEQDYRREILAINDEFNAKEIEINKRFEAQKKADRDLNRSLEAAWSYLSPSLRTQ